MRRSLLGGAALLAARGAEAQVATLGAGAFKVAGAATLDLNFMTPGTLPPNVVFTRASVGTYFNSAGTMQTATTNTPRWTYDPVTLALRGLLVEEARTNSIPNSTMTGAVAGSPGTDPTGWTAATVGGLTKTIVGTGTENGIPYIDYRFNAASGTGGNLNFIFTPTTAGSIPASSGQVYTMSLYLAFKAGSTSGVNPFTVKINQWDAGSVSLGAQTSTVFGLPPFLIGDPLTKNRIPFTFAATPTNTAFIQPFFQLPTAAGAVDFTLRIGAPQLELGAFATSFIPTTAGAVTRAVEHCSLTDAVMFGGTTDRTIMVQGYSQQAAAPPSHQYWLSLNDASSANFLNLISPSGTSSIRAQVQVASVSLVNGGDRSYGAPPTMFKAALANGAIWSGAVNGVLLVNSGGLSQQLGPLSVLRVGESQVATGAVGGCVQRVQYWPRMLPDWELSRVTT